MLWLILVVSLVWAAIAFWRRHEALKDLEEIHAITQVRIRREMGRAPLVLPLPLTVSGVYEARAPRRLRKDGVDAEAA